MARKRKPLDAVGEAPLVARLLRSEPAGPRRERLLAVQLGFDAVNDLDHVASAVGHARSTNAVFNNAVLLVANRRLKAPARTSLMADRITQPIGERTAL